jgi:hypothetical protein
MAKEASVVFYAEKNFPEGLVSILHNLGFKDIEKHAKHFAADAPDSDWIRFAASKGWVILSRDRDIIVGRENSLEYKVFRECQAKGVFFAQYFGTLHRLRWAIWMFRNLDRLVETANTMQPGDVLIAHKSNRLDKIDPEKYRKRVASVKRRAAKRNAEKPQGLGKAARKMLQKQKALKEPADPRKPNLDI